jgi:hypothetical protein
MFVSDHRFRYLTTLLKVNREEKIQCMSWNEIKTVGTGPLTEPSIPTKTFIGQVYKHSYAFASLEVTFLCPSQNISFLLLVSTIGKQGTGLACFENNDGTHFSAGRELAKNSKWNRM